MCSELYGPPPIGISFVLCFGGSHSTHLFNLLIVTVTVYKPLQISSLVPPVETYEVEKYAINWPMFTCRDEEVAYQKLVWSVSDIQAVSDARVPG